MRLIFIDTSALIALGNPSGSRHAEATSIFRLSLREGTKFITSNFVLDETYTWLRRRVSHETAVKFGESLRETKLIDYLRISEEIESRAWEIAVEYRDRDFSFTDCTSFAAMEKLGIKDVFTFDERFKQYGFTPYS